MYLVHIDESSTDFEKGSDRLFTSGPYIFYGGLLVHEFKYHHIERLFSELVMKKLNINLAENGAEVHAYKIWHEAKGDVDKINTVKIFFEELLQLMTKMACPFSVGMGLKNQATDFATQNNLKKSTVRAFLSATEYALSELNENGTLIADQISSPGDASRQDEKEFQQILLDLMRWRISRESTNNFFSQFEFESRSIFLIGNLHYVSSSDSLMIQLVDCVMWVLQRMFIYYSPLTNEPDINKCPVSTATFNFFLKRTAQFSYFDLIKKDFMISDFRKDFSSSYREDVGSFLRILEKK